jgi:S-layer protein
VLGDGEDFTWVLNQFANSAEARVLYGDIQADNIAEVVDAIYMGLFNRHAEQEGLDFWVNSFNTGASTPATILWNVMMGAQGLDDQTIDNKVVAASRFTEALDPELDGRPPFQATFLGTEDNDAVRAWLAAVTYNGATIPSMTETITWVQDTIADPGDPILVYNTYTLTTGVDNIAIAGLSNDLVQGIIDGGGATSTYTNGDTINGNGLTDMELVVVDDGNAAAFVTVNNVDDINIVAADNGTININAIGWSNIDAVNLVRGVDGLSVNLTNLPDGADLSIASGIAGTIDVDYAGGAEAHLEADKASSVSFVRLKP